MQVPTKVLSTPDLNIVNSYQQVHKKNWDKQRKDNENYKTQEWKREFIRKHWFKESFTVVVIS